MSFIIHWNVAGKLVSPKNMTVGSYKPRVRAEGGLFLISLSDSDVVVSPTNVELREVLGSAKFVDEFRD